MARITIAIIDCLYCRSCGTRNIDVQVKEGHWTCFLCGEESCITSASELSSVYRSDGISVPSTNALYGTLS